MRGNRFTPTRVGKMEDISKSFRRSSVHPHARGENVWGSPRTARIAGSPPRAWGKLLPRRLMQHDSRFTPTRVGKMNPQNQPIRRKPVHPHARGENRATTFSAISEPGSPPRAWGKSEQQVAHEPRHRFTPTRVGKMSWFISCALTLPVHPHARGENAMGVAGGLAAGGSPPRAWGKCLQRVLRDRLQRFTPTRVGKIQRVHPRHRAGPVHPHARGENSRARRQKIKCIGSPPRAWGKLHRQDCCESVYRFTPTRVGKILRVPAPLRAPAVHPHARGENPSGSCQPFRASGSPPRAWGKFVSFPGLLPFARFTPTRVGKMRGI